VPEKPFHGVSMIVVFRPIHPAPPPTFIPGGKDFAASDRIRSTS
jgi:hypothetical protein